MKGAKMNKYKETLKNVLIVVVILIACLSFVYIFQSIGQWDLVDKFGTLVGIPSTIFAYLAWVNAKALNKKKEPVLTRYGENSIALFVSMGNIGNIKNVIDYIRGYIRLPGNTNQSSSRIDAYQAIDKGTLKRQSGKSEKEDAIFKNENLRCETLDDYCVKAKQYEINVRVYRDLNTGLGKYIEVNTSKVDNTEASIQQYLNDFSKVLENLQNYFSLNTVSEIHLFQGGMIPAALVLQNVFSNRYVVYPYHWATGNYLMAGKLDKGSYNKTVEKK